MHVAHAPSASQALLHDITIARLNQSLDDDTTSAVPAVSGLRNNLLRDNLPLRTTLAKLSDYELHALDAALDRHRSHITQLSEWSRQQHLEARLQPVASVSTVTISNDERLRRKKALRCRVLHDRIIEARKHIARIE